MEASVNHKPENMDTSCSKMTQSLLNLTLEIIYLLTGQDYGPIKKEPGDPPSPSSPEEKNNEKILEVTQKITELLTGEVPIRCEDVTVYFSMEEWEYLEGHKDIYKDIKMEDQPSLTLPDGSRNRNPPDPCLLYPQDSSNKIPQDVKGDGVIDVNVEVKKEAEDPFLSGHDSCKEEEIPLEISTDGSYSRTRSETSTLLYECLNVVDENITHSSQAGILSTNVSPLCFYTPKPSNILNSTDHFTFESKACHSGIVEQDVTITPSNLNTQYHEPSKHSAVHPNTHSKVRTGQTEMLTPSSCNRSQQYLARELGISSDVKNVIIKFGEGTQEKAEDPSNFYSTNDKNPSSGNATEHQTCPQSSPLSTEKNKPAKKMFTCEECGKSLTRKENLVSHRRIHSGEKPFSCSECGKTFKKSSHLSKHRQIHIGNKRFSCSQCEKTFFWKGDLLVHQRIHSGLKPYICSECGKGFSLKSYLVRHHRTHTGERPYTCSYCGKTFSSRSNLVMHLKVHSGQKPFTCLDCGKNFTFKFDLVSHQRVHTGEKPYSCPECKKSFSSQSYYNKHLRIHTGERPYSCTECDKSFYTSSQLAIHQRSHTGMKPYTCEECGQSFAWRANFVKHRRWHTGEKPIQCPDCKMGFITKWELRNHWKTHTGEKPYSCSECGRAFIQMGRLQKHQLKHAKIDENKDQATQN